MEKIKENPAIFIIGLGVILCCVFASVWAVQSVRNTEVIEPPAPLSDIVLKSDELALSFERDGIAPVCQEYLTIPFSQTDLTENPIDCYQVKFSDNDHSSIVLNAIWVFADSAKAEVAFRKLTERVPVANNIDINIIDVSVPLGDQSIASTAKVTGSWSPFYVTNLYWKYDNAVVRLSVINHSGFIPVEEILKPARNIEMRLESR